MRLAILTQFLEVGAGRPIRPVFFLEAKFGPDGFT